MSGESSEMRAVFGLVAGEAMDKLEQLQPGLLGVIVLGVLPRGDDPQDMSCEIRLRGSSAALIGALDTMIPQIKANLARRQAVLKEREREI